jgi:hypothetical protein
MVVINNKWGIEWTKPLWNMGVFTAPRMRVVADSHFEIAIAVNSCETVLLVRDERRVPSWKSLGEVHQHFPSRLDIGPSQGAIEKILIGSLVSEKGQTRVTVRCLAMV